MVDNIVKVPTTLRNETEVRRFLLQLVSAVDKLRNQGASTTEAVTQVSTEIPSVISEVLKYKEHYTLVDSKSLVHKKWVDDNKVAKVTITPLALTVSNPPTQAEVQSIADKVDEIISSLS